MSGIVIFSSYMDYVKRESIILNLNLFSFSPIFVRSTKFYLIKFI